MVYLLFVGLVLASAMKERDREKRESKREKEKATDICGKFWIREVHLPLFLS